MSRRLPFRKPAVPPNGQGNLLDEIDNLCSGALIVCVLLILVLFFRVLSLENRVRGIGEPNDGGIAARKESLKSMQAELAAAKELAPGLAEYMTTIQLHAAKLWFAAKASHWELAAYELHELEETMETVIKLNVEKMASKSPTSWTRS